MKVIDLLNKIANGEEYPKIKFNNSIYEYHDKEHGYCRYYHDNTYICLNSDYYLFDILNDEVEVIEDSIKKLPKEVRQPNNFEEVVYIAEDLVNKINEIIDYLEENK